MISPIIQKAAIHSHDFLFYQEIDYCDPLLIFARFAHSAWALWLDSANQQNRNDPTAHYSYILVHPFKTWSYREGQLTDHQGNTHASTKPLDEIQAQWKHYPMTAIEGLPPMQSGIAGFCSYDLNTTLEYIPLTAPPHAFPAMAVGFYNQVISFDHATQRAFILCSTLGDNPAAEQLDALIKRCRADFSLKPFQKSPMTASPIQHSLSQEQYESTIKIIQEHITNGDIFQTNFTTALNTTLSKNADPFDLYQRLRLLNPSPFSAYFNVGDKVIASSSPERFLKAHHGYIETRPIKGTCPRGKNPTDDALLKNTLLHSAKDRAENTMIVDVLRNDLSRVCEPHSVRVPTLCGLEAFPSVWHLVSVVTGILSVHHNIWDLFKACFPGGSITGAPKIRAMEIINELETQRRGPYCGALGYWGFDGNMDTSILIRTYTIDSNHVTFQAGGGITLDSDPLKEYEEMQMKWHKLTTALTHDFNH